MSITHMTPSKLEYYTEKLKQQIEDVYYDKDTIDDKLSYIEVGSYTLPTANSSTLGGVKIDGTTINIDENGVISGSSSIDKIEDIDDVQLTSIQNGQALIWDSTNSKWVNGTVSSGGGNNTNSSGTVIDNQPLGTIISYFGKTAPNNYLVCDGDIYNISDYKELAEFIKIQFGSYNKFGGDGTSTFAVPDLQGEFLRGSGTNSHTNQGNGYEVGEHQDATEILNVGKFSGSTSPSIRVASSSNTDALSKNADSEFNQMSNTGYSKLTAGSATMTQYFTSRPTNTSVLFCIKYRSTDMDLYYSYDNYNEEETVIGVWKDGKPIYRKIFQLSIPRGKVTNYVLQDMTSYNIDTYIDSNLGNYNYYVSSSWFVYPRYDETLKSIIVSTGTSVTSSNISCTIEYTKTSDSEDSFTTSLITNNVKVSGIHYEDYSENEIVIGKWIDGKPIYRKYLGEYPATISTSNSGVPSELQSTLDSIEIDILTNALLSIQNKHAIIPFQLWYTSPTWYWRGFDTWGSKHTCSVTIEYTKTSDSENSFTPDMVTSGISSTEATDDEVQEVLTW